MSHPSNVPVCAMKGPLYPAFKSYGMEMPLFASPAERLCSDAPGANTSRQAGVHRENRTAGVHAVVIFKSARCGSTFFDEITNRLVQAAKLHTAHHWEPFSAVGCANQQNVVEAAFAFLLSRCHYSYKSTSKCTPIPSPTDQLQCFNRSSRLVDVSITALNPRFSWEARWSKLAPELLPPASSVIINLRRTNLVTMAYSKFHHGGCGKNATQNATQVDFSLHVLLQCVWHYAVGDQEYASSSALTAATSSGAPLYLFLYEDALADPGRMQSQIAISILGHAPAGLVHSKSTKVHNKELCDYPDVKCTSQGGNRTSGGVLKGLFASNQPCLVRQWLAAPGIAFTMPHRENGTISLAGRCDPLRSLAQLNGARSLAELYSVT